MVGEEGVVCLELGNLLGEGPAEGNRRPGGGRSGGRLANFGEVKRLLLA